MPEQERLRAKWQFFLDELTQSGKIAEIIQSEKARLEKTLKPLGLAVRGNPEIEYWGTQGIRLSWEIKEYGKA